MQIVACPDDRLPEDLELWPLAGAGPRCPGVASAPMAAGELLLARHGARRIASIVVSTPAQATGFWEAIGYRRLPDPVRFGRHRPPRS